MRGSVLVVVVPSPVTIARCMLPISPGGNASIVISPYNCQPCSTGSILCFRVYHPPVTVIKLVCNR